MVERDDETHKRVEFAAKDDADQTATGVVMVPDTVDLQQDFAREETIRNFAAQFSGLIEAGEAGGGVMHAVFPADWMSLKRNEVLDSPETIGEKEVPAGAWVQEWQYHHDELWQLVADGVLAGYSIGAVGVEWGGPHEVSDLDDVTVPDAVADSVDDPNDMLAFELRDAVIEEVSSVDIPAVPDAEILAKSSGSEKRLGEHLGSRDEFISAAVDRGHTEGEAERLWSVLHEATDIPGASDPRESRDSMLQRVGKAFLSMAPGGGSPGTGLDTRTTRAASTAATGDESTTDSRPNATAKAGQTLSEDNRHRAMATVDAALGQLEDAGVSHGMTRFTDRDEFDFDLSDHDAAEWGDGGDGSDSPFSDTPVGDGETAAAETDAPTPDDDPGGDTPEADTMSRNNDDDEDDEQPTTADLMAEIQELKDGESDKADPDADDGNTDGDDDLAEVKETLREVAEQVSDNADTIQRMKQQSGLGGGSGSDQLGGGGGKNANADDDDALDQVAKILS